jgi:hypothetical protein
VRVVSRKKARKVSLAVIVVSYTCNQPATVTISANVTIPATVHAGNRTKAKTLKLTPVSASAAAGVAAPAVVLTLPAAAIRALNVGTRLPAVVAFKVQNANGLGVATLKVVAAPQGKRHA